MVNAILPVCALTPAKMTKKIALLNFVLLIVYTPRSEMVRAIQRVSSPGIVITTVEIAQASVLLGVRTVPWVI